MAAVHDVIGDMITKIRNASNAGKDKVVCRYSKIKHDICNILVQEGFLDKVETVGDEQKKGLRLTLKYFNGEPVIEGVQRISKPGRRIYRGAEEIPRYMNGLAVTIVSTSNGVCTGKEAKTKNVGGELLCYIW